MFLVLVVAKLQALPIKRKQFILLFFSLFGIIIIGDDMNIRGSKRDLFYLILLVLTLVTMIIGITFTYLALVSSEKKDSTRIQTGMLAINYVDGKNINAYLLMPINEPTLETKYSVYKKNFSVASSGTLDQTLDIFINVTKNEFKNNALKYAIYDANNEKIGIGSIPASGNIVIASDLYLKSGATNNYTVLIWLQENNLNQDYEQGNSFIGGFEIIANQIKYE